MRRQAITAAGLGVLLVGFTPAATPGSPAPQAGAAGTYQVVEVCSLLSLAEVKKLAPWPPHLDAIAAAEEEAIGTHGSSCNYPTVHVQVMAFRQQTIDSARKTRTLEPVAGIGDEAYVHNNKDRYAELYARVGPHLLTLQLNIGADQTFDTAKPSLVALAKTFAARLR